MKTEELIAAALASAASDSDDDRARTADNLTAFQADDNASMMGGWT